MAIWSKKGGADGAVASKATSNESTAHEESSVQKQQALSTGELQQRAAASKQQMASFGEIVSIFMRNPQFRALSLGELETLVVPAVVANQFVIAEAQSKQNGFIAPIGAALWASVSTEVDQRLSTNLDQPIKLAPNEWKSGDIPWLVTVVGDSRMVNPMLQRLCKTALKGLPLKVRVKDKNGRDAVGTFSAAAA
jgi:hemolysin-activating ACP:hemolysin acyltransferase